MSTVTQLVQTFLWTEPFLGLAYDSQEREEGRE